MIPGETTAQRALAREKYSHRLLILDQSVESIADALPARSNPYCSSQITHLRREIHTAAQDMATLRESIWTLAEEVGEPSISDHRQDAVAQQALEQAHTSLSEFDYAVRTEDGEAAYWNARTAIVQLRVCSDSLELLLTTLGDVMVGVAA